jgi:hypothetical protein
MFLQPVDFIFVMIGLCALWGIAEIHNVLKQILYELNPRKRPLKGVVRKKRRT